MNTSKKRRKKTQLIHHRKEQYNHAIQKVIDGKAEPNYATKRWNKLRDVNKRKGRR